MADLSTDRARLASAPSRHQFRGALLGACACALAVTLATASSPATAQAPLRVKAKLKQKQIEHVSKEPFGDIPKGPLQIVVSIDEQQLHLYSNGTHVADTLIATGVAAHPTPMGTPNQSTWAKPRGMLSSEATGAVIALGRIA